MHHTYLCSDIRLHPRNVLHIHLFEDVGDEFHAMIIANGHELVILFLGDFMADALTIDNSCHPKEGVSFLVFLYLALLIANRLNLNIIDLYLPTMSAITRPTR